MSVDAGIYISWARPVNVIGVLEAIFNEGWNVNDNGHISFLNLHDDNFDWEWIGIDQWNEVENIINNKVLLDEVIGLSVLWGESNIGCEIIFEKGYKKAIFSLSINTKKNGHVVDFSWYLNRLQSALTNDCFLEEILCSQYFY